ncbi:MAG TPA: hypothetical protein VEL70_09275 [Candidatus Acidoferrum sp.]|nr:hypothetical protein [Candidatus Acidoferrum sp.]
MKREYHGDDNSNNNNVDDLTPSRHNVLTIIDSIIEQIFQIRKTLFGVSISALILAPIAIGLSIFLLQHPSFVAVLEIENEFGIALGILLIAVIMISSIWIISGVKQYRTISSWNQRYNEYVKEKQEIDRNIAKRYGLDNYQA